MTDLTDIALQRLYNERLLGQLFDTPEAVVGWLGAVQAQDYPGAKWGVGQRVAHCDDATVHEAFQRGAILRTHAMRPTWHFVLPADIRWLQELTGPRVHAANAYYYRKLELDEEAFKQTENVIAKALQGGKQLTRTELAAKFAKAHIDARGLRLAYIIMHAELEGLICSGAMRGKQHTYALLEERAPKARTLTRDEALAVLTNRYFASHGPAQVQDFAWWSGLAIADVKKGLDFVKSILSRETVGGKEYWFAGSSTPERPIIPMIHLLPNYDEALIAYKDRSALLDPVTGSLNIELLIDHLIVRNGHVIGGWRRRLSKNEVVVHARLPAPLNSTDQKMLENAVQRYGEFLHLPAQLTL